MSSFNSSPWSSISVPTGRWTHEVFLSFRGEDTRNNFVDHLYTALVKRGLNVFKDDQALHKGKPISLELLKAIEESKFAVVVFSQNYADSSWCLDELLKIMECRDQIGQMVLPVFYHVDPSDLRRQKRDYNTAFQKHQDKFRGEMEKVNKWRNALATAAGLSGWHIKDNMGEASIIPEIVKKILDGIQPCDMDKNLFGMDSRIDELYSLLSMEATEEVRMIGILGMGGIGKTTIAKAVFRRIANKFESSCFVKDVREKTFSERAICALQENLLFEIIDTDREFYFSDPEEGACRMQQLLCNKKVLLVLDGVDDVEQIKFLAATREWFGRGSRIIITTRDEHLLSDVDAKYKPDFLLMNEAVDLFCRHAFGKRSPPEGYGELSNRAIRYASCLPLALKVLGSFFHGRKIGVWESALTRLGKTSNSKILEALKLSFDGLDVSEKQIFLDIACFFKGKNEDHVTRVLDSFGFDPVIGISILIEKSLITISNERLDMHDLIQEMGWHIVHESFPNSRLWHFQQVHDFIKGRKNPKAIEAIMLTDNEYDVNDYDAKLGLSADVFGRMKNLRLLDVDGNFTSALPAFFPDGLRWLCWTDYPFSTLPLTDMCKLAGLELAGESAIEHLWKGQKILPNLKYIHLENARITSFPDVTGAPNIEKLILSGCHGLVKVHESLGSHRRLVYVDMNGCYKLKHFPSRLEMESLETLILSGCSTLKRFPKVSKCMVKLSQIHLDFCCRIKELPTSIKYLSSLSFLNLANCSKLKKIPDSICQLEHLKCLHLLNCLKLKKLPKKLQSMEMLEELWLGIEFDFGRPAMPVGFRSLTGLTSLRKLDLSLRQLEEESFPETLHAFSSLEELYLSGNSKLVQLPSIISHLSHLKRLELNQCSQLESLCVLPSSLQVLKANDCISLRKIGDLSKEWKWLYKIWLANCQKLLEDEENQRCLDKLFQLSFVKECAAVNHRLSIAIPGSKIPSWLKEEKDGCRITLKLPDKWHTQIMGFVVCGVFPGKWCSGFPSAHIIFRIVNDGKTILKSEVCHVNTVETAENGGNVWISYIPLSFFQHLYHDYQPEDWSHIQGHLHMTVMSTFDSQSARCGAHIIYKEDVQQSTTCISDYGNVVHTDNEDLKYNEMISGNTYVDEEKFDDKSLMPLRSRISTRRNTKHIICRFQLSGRIRRRH